MGRWVIISETRGKRPSDWANEPNLRGGRVCPFCAGNENRTPPEIWASRPGDASTWNVRVVANKYPALTIEAEMNGGDHGFHEMLGGVGAHEVIIETPRHSEDLADLSVERIRDVLVAFRCRADDLRRDVRLKHLLFFKNHGVAAGASLEHSHSQLIATPIVPKRVAEELDGALGFYQKHKTCVYCHLIAYELESRERLVFSTDHHVVVEPFAPRFPYETWILPSRHLSHFEWMSDDMYLDLAGALKKTLLKINKLLGYPPFNFVLHSSPVSDNELKEYHWHFEIIPKLSKVAGFEWGTGFYINPIPPEIAADDLRQINC